MYFNQSGQPVMLSKYFSQRNEAVMLPKHLNQRGQAEMLPIYLNQKGQAVILQKNFNQMGQEVMLSMYFNQMSKQLCSQNISVIDMICIRFLFQFSKGPFILWRRTGWGGGFIFNIVIRPFGMQEDLNHTDREKETILLENIGNKSCLSFQVLFAVTSIADFQSILDSFVCVSVSEFTFPQRVSVMIPSPPK